MPEFVLTLLGIAGGLVVIAGALYLAVRPEFQPKRRKSWLAKPSGAPHDAGSFSPIDVSRLDHGGSIGP
jgi:hypothetical protein